MVERSENLFLKSAGSWLDNLVMAVSPRTGYRRMAYRFGYDVLDRSRLRTKRIGLGGTGDQQLTADALDKLRDICRDMGRNNPLVTGILRVEANGVVGTETQIQARTGDDGWNAAAEQLWDDEMIAQPGDVTGRFDFHALLKKFFLSYRRDGDAFVLFLDDSLQAIEGEEVGTPWGSKNDALYFDVNNGVAFSKQTRRVIGYYIGKRNKWGYIRNEDYQRYPADVVHHLFNTERFTCSRGEPALTSSVHFIEQLCGYIDAELVASKINACWPMMVRTYDTTGMPAGYTGGVSATGKTEDEKIIEKIEPGQVWHGEPGEDIAAIGAARPPSAFDSFVLRMLAFIGRPLCLPLMLITGDFSGATFMNARIAYQEARENWKDEQNLVLKPFIRRVWLWKVAKWIERGDLTARDDWKRHEIWCKRWPYVNPYQEADADKLQLANGTMTRTEICARQGRDFRDVTDERAKEEEYLQTKKVVLVPDKVLK